MASSATTRQHSVIYLLGTIESEILGAKIPSLRQVFGFFLHQHLNMKKTTRESSSATIAIVTKFWVKARIPQKAVQHSIKKLEKVFNEWNGLKKHKERTSESHKNSEKAFTDQLDVIFDIAHADALSLMQNPEDKAFLLAQREPNRRGTLGCVDMVDVKKSKNRNERTKNFQKRQWQALESQQATASQVTFTSSSSSDAEEKDDLGNVAGRTLYTPPKKRITRSQEVKHNILTSGLTAALDRTNISSRNAAYVLAEASSSLGHNISNLNISRSSIHKHRQDNRSQAMAKIKNDFKCDGPLVVHWDGKLMEDLTTNAHVDRLPVIISGLNIKQLLGVPKLEAGTGQAQALAIIALLDQWNVACQVQAMCFDTTASNTGHRNGACIILEQLLDRDLLHLACRHHILELVLASAFENTVGVSSGPNIPIFKRFKDKWNSINQNDFKPASSDKFVELAVQSMRNNCVAFLKDKLQTTQPRDDYREFLELVLIFLGGVQVANTKFKAPGAMHHARWMSKGIYSIKMWMFRDQFKMTSKEVIGLRDIALFITIVYIKAWYTASVAAVAPFNDFTMLKSIINYPNQIIAKAASKKLSNHLWYLSEELVGLALFDPRVPIDTKRLIVTAMKEEAEENPPKRIKLDLNRFQHENRGLEQFATSNSLALFQRLGLCSNFLAIDPIKWERNGDYQKAFDMIRNLAVTNDNAERGVALISEFNKKLTHGEEQLQFLLQIVTEHRRQFPDCRKSTLLAGTRQQ